MMMIYYDYIGEEINEKTMEKLDSIRNIGVSKEHAIKKGMDIIKYVRNAERA